jgi:7-keto-8-aminopelargonate synthetase-like enzyme
MSGPKSKLANGRTVTNLASYNYYNLVANEHIKEKAIETLRTYGVGPCGPPQFYGTQDVHMKTEADVASHLGTEACIVYAQSFSTISSVIPAFSKRGDIIVADKACNYAIRKGLQICRSTIRWYEHNDMEDLERVLQRVVKEQSRKPLTRRFIVTEGLFETVGDCVDLPKVVSLTNFPVDSYSSHADNDTRLNSASATNSASSSTRPGPSVSSAALAAVSRKPKTSTPPPST